MKKLYEALSVDVVKFEAQDVITASGLIPDEEIPEKELPNEEIPGEDIPEEIPGNGGNQDVAM